jgi:hypothetical protein
MSVRYSFQRVKVWYISNLKFYSELTGDEAATTRRICDFSTGDAKACWWQRTSYAILAVIELANSAVNSSRSSEAKATLARAWGSFDCCEQCGDGKYKELHRE